MLKKTVAGLILSWMCLAGALLQAVEAPSASADPVLEKRVMAISEELRCLVCQNQTIADSHAELAIDLRNQVREMLQKGMSEKEIKRYMVDRYGDFVLYRPQVQSNTWLLWLGPFALLLGALAFALAKLRQRSRKVAEAGDTLSDESLKRAERLLGIAGGASAASVGSPEIPASSTKDKA